MGRRMSPSRHEQTADARHWKRRLADEEEREMLADTSPPALCGEERGGE